MLSGATETLTYAAEALVLAQDFDAAQAHIDEARQLVERLGERVYLPQLLMVEAAVARGRGEPGAAATCSRQALAEARGQGATWLELLALIDLVAHGDPSAAEVADLRALVHQLDEARDTPAVARALALLAAQPRTH